MVLLCHQAHHAWNFALWLALLFLQQSPIYAGLNSVAWNAQNNNFYCDLQSVHWCVLQSPTSHYNVLQNYSKFNVCIYLRLRGLALTVMSLTSKIINNISGFLVIQALRRLRIMLLGFIILLVSCLTSVILLNYPESCLTSRATYHLHLYYAIAFWELWLSESWDFTKVHWCRNYREVIIP